MAKKRKAGPVGPPGVPPEALAHIVEPLRPFAVEVGTLNLDPANSIEHTEIDLRAIAESLRTLGQHIPIVGREDGRIITKGNGTFRAATEILGWTHVAAIFLDDDEVTAALRGVADNRTGRLATFNEPVLAALLARLKQSSADETVTGFDSATIGRILERQATAEGRAAQDAEPEPPRERTDSGYRGPPPEDPPAEPTPPSNVRMVQLFLEPAALAEYNGLLAALAPKFKTTNAAETVLEALRRANK